MVGYDYGGIARFMVQRHHLFCRQAATGAHLARVNMRIQLYHVGHAYPH